MSIPLICAGFILLLNPCVWIWDILPDFIGAILIMYGIRKVSFISETSERVNVNLLALSLLSALKLALSVILRNEVGMTRVILSFVFAVLEGICLLRLFKDTFSFFELLQMRYCDSRETTPFVSMEGTGKMLSIYTVCRLAVGFFPEIAELSGKDYTLETYDLTSSRWTVYFLAAAVTFVAFAVIVPLFIKSMRRFAADRATLVNSVAAGEKMKASDPSDWYSKKWRLLKYLFVAGMLFSISLYVDWTDYLPKAIAAALLCTVSLFCVRISE